MATGKRYYWIKLKDTFFDDDGPADFLMSQTDGASYVVLYQMLCLKTINTNGRLSNQIGEVIIPYDIEKIRRTCKYFSAATIRVALNLYKALGLIYEDVNGTLVIADHTYMVGSETDWAAKKRRQMAGNNPPELSTPCGDDTGDNAWDAGGDTSGENLPIDIRDKEIRDIDIKRLRDKSIELNISNEIFCRTQDVQRVISAWNSLGLQSIRKIVPDTDRDKWLRKRIRDYGLEEVLAAVEKVRESDFLMGRNNNGWTATFDWFIRPNNFAKVASGNYNNRDPVRPSGKPPDADAEMQRKYDMARAWADGRT